MAIIVHPLTVLNGAPQYTASDFRQTVNPFLFPSDGSAFNGVSGVRYGAPSPLCTISGTTVTVKPHTGIMSPWTGIGGYTYAITSNTTVTIASTRASYKIAIVVNDPSQSHGTTPNGVLAVYASSIADSSIPGLVLATVANGVISDYAPMLQQNSIIVARSKTQLDGINAMKGQSARLTDGSRYVMGDDSWISLNNSIVYFTSQSATNFVMESYGSDNSIVVDRLNNLLHVRLCSFNPTVNVQSFPIYSYISGVKPSMDISLGNVGSKPSVNYGVQATWNSSGPITIIGGTVPNQIVKMSNCTIPIPDGVTFS